jgi:oligosaccharyltransferase complex subunit gamma
MLRNFVPPVSYHQTTVARSILFHIMRLLRIAAVTALTILSTVTARKAVTTSKFDTLKTQSFPIELDEKSYADLTTAPRDYSLAVLLTARDAKYACGICKEFDPEWSIIGRSWSKGDRSGEKRVALTTLDFDQGRNVFMKV